MSKAKFSMKPGTRVVYSWNTPDDKKRRVARFIALDGGYFLFMAGSGRFSPNANHIIALYENEFELLSSSATRKPAR